MTANFQITNELIQSVIKIAKQAGAVIMDVYKTNFEIHIKNDKSPVTEADTRANDIITAGLLKIAPDIPVLSEEGLHIPFEERSKWESYWLVDPLDGTKEFIKKNDEFTVNIAFLANNQPVFGVVYAPALNKLYFGSSEKGSFKSNEGDAFTPISVNSKVTNPVQIADKIQYICESEKMRILVAEKGYHYYNQNFTCKILGSKLKTILVNL